MKKVIKVAHGFTLIELLVVVLIIGILAAVAVPQYQKAVEKAKAAEIMPLLKSTYHAFEHYYVSNGVYPTSFAQLDIDMPGTQITTNSAKENGKDLYKVSEDWAIELGGNSSSGAAGIKTYRLTGPYVGAGFAIWHYYHKLCIPPRKIICDETKVSYNGLSTYDTNKLGKGAYCEKLFHGQLCPKTDSSDSFVLP